MKIFSNIKRDSILYRKKQVSTQPSMQTTLLHEGGTHIGNMLLQYTWGNENIVLQQFAMRTLYGMLLRWIQNQALLTTSERSSKVLPPSKTRPLIG